jgi:hypothetical protein
MGLASFEVLVRHGGAGGPGERGRCQKIGRMDPISPMTERAEYSQEEGHVEMS